MGSEANQIFANDGRFIDRLAIQNQIALAEHSADGSRPILLKNPGREFSWQDLIVVGDEYVVDGLIFTAVRLIVTKNPPSNARRRVFR
jgi:hypothetical protein